MVECVTSEVGASWAMYQGDCVEAMAGMPDNSIGEQHDLFAQAEVAGA